MLKKLKHYCDYTYIYIHICFQSLNDIEWYIIKISSHNLIMYLYVRREFTLTIICGIYLLHYYERKCDLQTVHLISNYLYIKLYISI